MKRIVCLLFLAALARPAERWQIQYFYDEDESSLAIHDLACPSPDRCIAVGRLTRKGRQKPAALITADGGRRWTLTEPPDTGFTLFFLNETVGWMAGRNGLWKTVEGGANWERVKSPRGILRVYFLDEKRGFAVGTEKQILETSDGGQNWSKIAAAAEPKTTPENTVYAWIAFANARNGIISGWSRRAERGARLPDWMDPEEAAARRERPSISILVQTQDGGRSWKASGASMFGSITRLRLAPDGRGLALTQYTSTFEYPSEVTQLNWTTGVNTRVFRRKDRNVTDIALTAEGSGYLAAVEPQGVEIRLPVPGKLKMYRSRNLFDWEEMAVDYRAFGSRAMLAAAAPGQVWVATDTGMILKLVSQ